MISVALGSQYGSCLSARVWQSNTEPDANLLTVESLCMIDPAPGQIFDKTTLVFQGTRDELRRLAEAIYDAAEQIVDPPVVKTEDNEPAGPWTDRDPDIEELLKRPQI